MPYDTLTPPAVGTVTAVGWHLDGFARSLTAVSDATVEAYTGDLRAFVTWAERLGLDGPGKGRPAHPPPLPRLPRHTGTAKRTIARRASSLRRYFRWLQRTGVITGDPTAGLSAPKGEARLPRCSGPTSSAT